MVKKIAILGIGVAVVAAVVVVVTRVDEPAEKEIEAVREEPRPERNAGEDREAILAKLAMERGGLPIDQALRRASTPEAKAFIERDLAYQRQTRAEAASEAKARLDEVKSLLAGATEPETRTALARQVEMLEKLIANLER